MIKHNSWAALPAFDLVDPLQGPRICVSNKFQVIHILLVQDHPLRTTAPLERCGASCVCGGWIQLIYSKSSRQGSSGGIWSHQLLSSWELEKADTVENWQEVGWRGPGEDEFEMEFNLEYFLMEEPSGELK